MTDQIEEEINLNQNNQFSPDHLGTYHNELDQLTGDNENTLDIVRTHDRKEMNIAEHSVQQDSNKVPGKTPKEQNQLAPL